MAFDVKADLTSQTARINYDKTKVDINDMEEVINSLGFEVLGIDGQLEVNEDEIYKNDLKDKRNRIVVGFTASAILMILMYVHWMPFGLSMGVVSLIISIVPFLYVSLPTLKAGFNGIIHKNLNMDVMYSMGIAVAYVSSILGTFNIVLDHSFMFYETAVMLPSFLLVGRYLEARAKKKTSDSIRELIGLQPTVATLIELDDGGNILSQREVNISEIQIDDILLVRPGDKIPVDGEVIGGHSYVDESMINGEPIPKAKRDGEEVFAGTINQDGILHIKAQKIGKQTVLSNIIRLVEKAQSSRPPVQKLANTAVSYFIPTILTIAVVVFMLWYFVFDSTLLFALTTLISILVVACPCALGLATPTAVTVGVGRAAEFGILIKNGDTLENAGKIDVAAFDKTGTITEGQPEVDDIICYGISENELVELAASVEKNSNHPIAKAIVRKANDMNLELNQTSSFENITGKGLKAQVDDKDVLAGNKKLLESQNIEIPQSVLEEYENLENLSKTIIFVAIDGAVKGILSFSDKIKANSKRTIEELHKMGIETYMLTGDNKKTALNVASQVAGIFIGTSNYYNIISNIIQYNTYGIYLEDVSNDLNINFNIISHNYGFNFYNNMECNRINVTYNWWGSNNFDSISQHLYCNNNVHYFDFKPFLYLYTSISSYKSHNGLITGATICADLTNGWDGVGGSYLEDSSNLGCIPDGLIVKFNGVDVILL